ncbi:hypothetical protein Gotri_026392 [Gossypium trilobum]|uniref:RING-type domain-containing protein n=1 Tax=Gossypium trilobum TaxID=34281 RepID=A0A7J9FGK4_9ROSI|nr:hypothetical protein [Gossypium trilobum]
MEQTHENLHESNDHVLDIAPNDGQVVNNVDSHEPVIQPSSSHGISRNEKPQAPLSTWIMGYAAGCAASIPILFQHCFLPYPTYLEFTMPFILCVVLACCCGDLGLIKGASSECIDSLPTYTFKLQKDGSGSIRKINSEVKGGAETVGTEKDCAIPGDDAVCCICLASYADNDMLKELPCSHFFHTNCVDKWLKMKALCPLCKCSVLITK